MSYAIESFDPEIYEAIENELERETDHLEMIASENFTFPEVMEAMVERTKMAGGEVVKLLGNGSAFYSPASSAIAMAEAILRDQKRVLPVCALLKGEFGVDNYYVGVPCVLGAAGVERIVEFDLSVKEQEMFDNSVAAVKKLIDELPTILPERSAIMWTSTLARAYVGPERPTVQAARFPACQPTALPWGA